MSQDDNLEDPVDTSEIIDERPPIPPDTLVEGPIEAVPSRPDDVPEAFWDAAAGTIDTRALLQSHHELQARLGQLTGDDDGLDDAVRSRLQELPGRPDSPEGYAIEPLAGGLVEPDPEVNGRLHAAGFTQAQARLVYELAAERLVPTVAEVAGELEAQRQVDRLERHFGGAEPWRETARQLRTWAEGNLEPEVYATLASSHDGVLALHRMMAARVEPELLDGAAGPGAALNDEALGEMVRDPRYWRRREPEFVARVTDGFRRLYGG